MKDLLNVVVCIEGGEEVVELRGFLRAGGQSAEAFLALWPPGELSDGGGEATAGQGRSHEVKVRRTAEHRRAGPVASLVASCVVAVVDAFGFVVTLVV